VTVSAPRGRPLLADVVRSELKRLILGGEFPVGSKLPNEDRLCERFGVSRVTIREAVRGLIEDGLVVRRHGSGTYVTRRPLIRNSLDVNYSYTEHFQTAGLRPGRKLLGLRTRAATEDDAEALAVDAGTPIREIRRVRTADGRPVVLSRDILPFRLTRGEQRVLAALERGSIYEVFERDLGIVIHHGLATFQPTRADGHVATSLAVSRGALLLYLRQVDFDASGRPVLSAHEHHLADAFEFSVVRRGPGRRYT